MIIAARRPCSTGRLASLAYAGGHVPEALAMLDEVLPRNPTDASALLMKHLARAAEL